MRAADAKAAYWETERVHDAGSPAAEPELECQQALMLDVLRAARGEPVTYGELQDAGIEYPASVAEELELAGVAIERVEARTQAGRRRGRGVRLAAAEPPAEAIPRTSTRRYRTGLLPPLPAALRPRAGGRHEPERALVPVLLVAVAAATIALVLIAVNRGSAPQASPERAAGVSRPLTRARRSLHASATVAPAAAGASQSASPAATVPQPSPASTPPAPPATPAAAAPSIPLAATLEARGHAMLESGNATQAVPVLERAVAASGGSLPRCAEPEGEACLTYAYALFDLGSALRREGRASAAIPILTLRLQIANQRPTVADELDQARRELRTRA